MLSSVTFFLIALASAAATAAAASILNLVIGKVMSIGARGKKEPMTVFSHSKAA